MGSLTRREWQDKCEGNWRSTQRRTSDITGLGKLVAAVVRANKTPQLAVYDPGSSTFQILSSLGNYPYSTDTGAAPAYNAQQQKLYFSADTTKFGAEPATLEVSTGVTS